MPLLSGTLLHATLTIAGQPLLTDVPPTVRALEDPRGTGIFLCAQAPEPSNRLLLVLGRLHGVRRWLSLYRYEPFWMEPRTGTAADPIPIETQFLLVERSDGSLAVLVPLIDGHFRCALQSEADGRLILVAESGNTAITSDRVRGLFIAGGTEPYELLEQSACSVCDFLKLGRLRRDKPTPTFMDQFGWCTWDAFYQEVSMEKVRRGLESFRAGGIQPRMMILDDGWQAVEKMPEGHTVLTAFSANEKFPGNLAATVQMAKEEFGVRTFLVWHTMMGYWGGIHPQRLSEYHTYRQTRRSLPGTAHYNPDVDKWWGPCVDLVDPRDAYRFFQDYHRWLRLQGVDGVKVDSQAALETIAEGLTSRVELMRRFHEALEGSVHVHFAGNLINCMSCANDMIYSTLNSALTRTSTDFWPRRPESHGRHLYTNAAVALWFGHFIWPDWDMFQSGHPMGSYHAAGRAICGGPVYVSDTPDGHDFSVLGRLVLPDGSVLRCPQPAVLAADTFFHNPTQEDVLLKIVNLNRIGGVIGLFNARYDAQKKLPPVTGSFRPADIPWLSGQRFAVYAHRAGTLETVKRDESRPVTVAMQEWELLTVVPIENGFAPIGLPEMYNSGGALTSLEHQDARTIRLRLRWGGRFLAWCERQVESIQLEEDGLSVPWTVSGNRLEVSLPDRGPLSLRIQLR